MTSSYKLPFTNYILNDILFNINPDLFSSSNTSESIILNDSVQIDLSYNDSSIDFSIDDLDLSYEVNNLNLGSTSNYASGDFDFDLEFNIDGNIRLIGDSNSIVSGEYNRVEGNLDLDSYFYLNEGLYVYNNRFSINNLSYTYTGDINIKSIEDYEVNLNNLNLNFTDSDNITWNIQSEGYNNNERTRYKIYGEHNSVHHSYIDYYTREYRLYNYNYLGIPSESLTTTKSSLDYHDSNSNKWEFDYYKDTPSTPYNRNRSPTVDGYNPELISNLIIEKNDIEILKLWENFKNTGESVLEISLNRLLEYSVDNQIISSLINNQTVEMNINSGINLALSMNRNVNSSLTDLTLIVENNNTYYNYFLSNIISKLEGLNNVKVKYFTENERSLEFFDSLSYLAGNNDLMIAFGDNEDSAARHYLNNGFSEGREMDGFDEWNYLASNTDLITHLNSNPFAGTRHYVKHGFYEQRNLNSFDHQSYLLNNPDLIVLGNDKTQLAKHYVQFGFDENRIISNNFYITGPSGSEGDTTSATSINENSTAVHTFTANETVTWSLSGGVDQTKFSINSSTGALSFNSAPDYENPTDADSNNTYIVSVRATDTANNVSNQTVTVSIDNVNEPPTEPYQQVYTHSSQLTASADSSINIPLLYTTSNTQSQLTGLTLNVHYNSSVLTPFGTNNGISGQVDAAISGNALIDDTNNLDNDTSTDKIIQLAWATFNSSFPGGTLPATLATFAFETPEIDFITGQAISTNINYTSMETSSGYSFYGLSTALTVQPFNLDVDGDGFVGALSDGLMVIRKMFGPIFAGDELTANAISTNATRTTTEIHDYLGNAINAGLLDVDQSGETKALEDGIMIMRHLLGASFAGDALITNAISSDSPYYGSDDASDSVRANINALIPPELTA